jgi:hypothetical protein
MFAIVVRESGDAHLIDGSGDIVRSNVVPLVRAAPGFVSGTWMTDRAGGTLNVLVFDSEEAANAALERAREAPRPPFMRLARADVFEVLATT